ncbi:hypothetical protein GIB67_020817 [Kingdonia uniflora]|uniref:Spt5 KOW domain-containing protein n=1 Tax=Kingdonia uniflora TaxID=39325 RepID=A0A7J7M7I0_9MAGN|nr:hypothetical protein GIB67_020817 [Kingdonia uniflora]
MTPGGVMSPVIEIATELSYTTRMVGGENEGPWFMSNILVRCFRYDGSCKVLIGQDWETVTALVDKMAIVVPRKSDRVKILSGEERGATGKLIGVDNTDGIVKIDDTLDVKILDMAILAKLAQ